MANKKDNYCTQWAGQYLAAGELSKRGYKVAFPLGNAECSDIMVRSPTGKYFTIEIKSFLAKTFI